MPVRDLVEAWAILVVLSFGTVLLAAYGTAGSNGTLVAGGVLALAGLKARVILSRYLGLAQSRFWTRVFDVIVGLFLIASFVVFLAGTGRPA
jgi:nitric oxide reductase NorF protein